MSHRGGGHKGPKRAKVSGQGAGAGAAREAEAAGATAAGAVEIRKAFVEIKKPETGDPDNVMTAKRDRGRKEEKERAERGRETKSPLHCN